MRNLQSKYAELPALLSIGFRPFFLLASAYTALSMVLWLPYFQGKLEISTSFAVVDWHIHEWLFGFLPAIITGFLLTAVPNWTGRLPIKGAPLAFLVSIWICGRITITFSDIIGWPVTAVIDCSFLILVAAVIAREIIVGRNWRNLKVLIPISILFLANILFHIESALQGSSDVSRRLGLSAGVVLIILIGGRIIPSFTRNWLVRENPGKLPKPFESYDMFSIAMTVLSLLSWVIFPENIAAGILLSLASIAQILCVARWVGYRTIAEPLVLVLHLSYLFVPVGLFLLSASIFASDLVPQAAGVHALGVGAIGSMTLSVMIRATLGHTGRKLTASLFTLIIFAAIFISAAVRILQAMSIGNPEIMLNISALGWIVAFGGFAIFFAPALLQPRR